jgi:DNA-binding CsgD family transcriptional regulator
MFPSARPLPGRSAEREAIDALLAAARDGLSGVLLLTGDPGAGKTRLLQYAADAAADLHVIRLAGVEAEARLGFGALHRLLRPFLDRIPRLPVPQRDALSAAFGLIGGAPPDRFLVGLATLTVLADVAADKPVLCLVDDVHWLDRESAEVLAFTARRLHADSLAFLLAARTGTGDQSVFASLARLRLGEPEEPEATLLPASASHALSVLDLGLGRYQSALDHAWAVFDDDPPSVGDLVLPVIVEAGVRGGNREAAEAALARMTERARAAGTPWGLGLLARCQALMSENEHAEACYRESADLLSRVPVALDLAHTRLLFGEWLRRRKRRAEAREHLRAAYQVFGSCGAVPFAERARTELLATGEQGRKRVALTANDLTSRERHVAILAASGHTNAEIAERLFVTVSTVEFHLNKVFRKLRISSRRQIAARMVS